MPTAPSTRFINGVIYRTAFDQHPASAMVVENGRVSWLGDAAYAPQAARSIDLSGAIVLPALTDPHIHLFAIANSRLQIPLGSAVAPSIDACLKRLAEHQTVLSAERWVEASDFDENKVNERRFPTLGEIDAVTGDRPTLIRRFCGHVAIANSAALKLLGLGPDTSSPLGGEIGRDDRGQLNGILREAAAEAAFAVVPVPPRQLLVDSLRQVLNDCARAGMVAAVDAAMGFTAPFEDEYRVWEDLRKSADLLPLRLGFMLKLNAHQAAEKGFNPSTDPYWQMMTLKFFADGIVGGRSAAVSEPFLDSDTLGAFVTDPAELEAEIIEAHCRGWQVAVHATGDRAVSAVIAAFEKANETQARPDSRHRIEHFFCPPQNAMVRMRNLGAAIVMQPSFLTQMNRSILNGFGKRAEQYYPARSALDAGVLYAGSSDAPTGRFSPWQGIEDFVTRGARETGIPIGLGEALSARQAIHCYTKAGAAVMKQEHWRGSLLPGMAADLIVVEEDPFKASTPDLRNVDVSMTMIDGRIVHDLRSTD